MLRGVDREMIAAAAKKQKYNFKLRNMNPMAGRVGLKDGIIEPCVVCSVDGIGIRGGADWLPCGEGSKASKEVESLSIVYTQGIFSHVASSTR
jgi:hypothetical protein